MFQKGAQQATQKAATLPVETGWQLSQWLLLAAESSNTQIGKYVDVAFFKYFLLLIQINLCHFYLLVCLSVPLSPFLTSSLAICLSFFFPFLSLSFS